MSSRQHVPFAVRVLHLVMIVALLFGYVSPAAAASRAAPAAPAPASAATPLSVEQAAANFNQAINDLINTPAAAAPELQALMQTRLEAAAAQYQAAQAQAATSAAPATAAPGTSDDYVYSANARSKSGDSAAWLMLGKPDGNRQSFDQAFSDSLSAKAPANAPAARPASGPTALVGPQAPLLGPTFAPGGVRPCAVMRVTVKDIYVQENGDSGGSGEWRLRLKVNGSEQQWNEDADDGATYQLNKTWDVSLADDSTTIRIESGGYEEDPGPDDSIAPIDRTFSSNDNWGLGDHDDFAVDSDTRYNLRYNIACVPPFFADLRATASVDRPSVPAGDSVTYTFIAFNDGPRPADNVEMTIALPTGMRNINASPSQGSGCSASGTTLTCNLLAINSGQQASVQVQADTPDDRIGAISASASVSHASSGQTDINPGDNTTNLNVTLLPKANTGVTLSAPALVQRNQTGATTYQVTASVSNGGPTLAPNVRLAPTLPAGVSLVTAAPTSGSCAGSGVCDLGDIVVNGSVGVVYTLQVGPGVLERTTLPFAASVAMQFPGAVEIDSTNNSATRATRLTFWDLQLGAIGPGGDVNAVAYVSNELFAGGAFGVKRWNGSAWSSVGSGGPLGTVYALLDDGAGGLYAGGDFTNIGPRLAHWNGSAWSSVGAGVPNGVVYALARDSDNDLYVGGQFSQIGALTTNNIARWDGSAWRKLGVGGVTQGYGSTQPQVRAIVADNAGGVYVGGLFKTPAPNVARWNKAADAWESLGSGIAYPGGTSVVHALALLDGRIYVGGRFASAGGTPMSRIAAWDAGTQQWSKLGAGIGGAGNLAVNSMVVANGELMIGGTFTTAGGVNSRHIARWNGAAWVPIGSGVDSGAVNALAVGEAPLTTFAGGTFTAADGGAVSNSIGQYHHEPANLAVSQTFTPNPPVAGQPLDIQLTISNVGTTPVQNVTLRDELPADATFVSATPAGACTNDAAVVTCAIASLAAGANTTITIRTNVAAVLNGPFVNRVWAGAAQLDQNPTDNRLLAAPNVNAQADLSVTLSAPALATAGETITYTLQAQNNGPATATNAALTFTLPNGGATLRSASGMTCATIASYADQVTLNCAIGTMISSNSRTATLVFDLRADTRGAHTATAAITSPIADPDTANNTQTATTTVDAVADVQATLSAPQLVYQPPQQVGSYSYNVRVANAGPSLARAVQATLTYPAQTTFVSASPACQQAAGAVVCQAGDLAVGESADFVVEVYVNVGTPHATALAATLATQADATEAQPSDNSAAATTNVSTNAADATVDLLLTQDGPATVYAGDVAIYTLRVTNQGAIASGATLTDTLPAGASFDPSNSDPDCYEADQANNSIVCRIDELAVGQARAWQLAAFIPADASAGATLRNSATIASTETEAQPANNTASSDATVDTRADLALTQEASHTSAAAGETVTFALTVKNNGPSQAKGVTLQNPQPQGMVLQSADASQGSCAIANDEVSCTLGDLGARDSLTVNVNMVAGSGTVTNTATVQAATDDPETANDTASASVEIASAARETRNFGKIDISADTFIDLSGGRVQAFGDVWLGEYLHLSNDTDSVIIDGDTINGEGTLTYRQEQTALFTGDFSGSLTNDEATITPNSDVEYLLNTYSGFAMNEFSISKVDFDSGRTDGESNELEIKTEGFDKTLSANLFIEPGLVLGGTVESFDFAIGSVEFAVTGARLRNDGLAADSVAMTLPAKWGGAETSVADLSITVDGVSIGGAQATVPLPNFKLSGDKVQVQDASITVVYNGDALMFTGQGTVAIDLPDNTQENQVEFSIDPSGEFSASVDKLSLTLAGSTLELNELAVNNSGASVAEGVLTLPASLNESTITVEDVSITADGLKIGGAAVELKLPDINIGNGEKVRFSSVVATLAISGNSYTFGVQATLQLRLPQNSQDIAVQAGINNAGEFSGALSSLTLKLANVQLALTNVQFNNRGLKVAQATLQLPPSLGGSSAALTDVRIDNSGISIGGGSAKFPFPDFKIGSANGFAVTGVTAQLTIAADRSYKITLAGTVQVKVKTISAAVTGSITVDSQNRVSGEIAAFNFNLSGLEVSIQNARVSNGELSVAEASLKTPPSWGGAAVAVYNLRVSSSGVRIGGGKFAVPEIKAGSISLGSLYGELKEEGNGYSISLGGKFRTPALGGPNCALGVDASMYVGANGATVVDLKAFEAQAASVAFQLRYVKVGLTGCRIPIAQTGFYLTRVQGSLTLAQNQTVIDLGITIANDGEWLKGDADMRMQFNPWQMDFNGSVTLFSIFKAAEMKATMRSGYFSAELRVRAVVFEGRASLTAWTTDGSFHLVGRAILTVGFNKGSVWEECLGVCVSIPPFDVRIGEVGTEFGEFNGGVWGLKGWASVFSFRAGFYIDSGGTFSVKNIDRYQLVTPPSVQQARALAESQLDSQTLSDEERTQLAGYSFSANEVTIDQNIAVSTDVMFVLARKGAAPTLTLIDPSGQRITPSNLPNGIQLVEAPVDDGATQTLYVVPQAATGTWKTVLTGGGNAYMLQVLGANPAPALDKLSVVNTSANSAAADWTLASDEITTTLDIYVTPGPITATHTITEANGQTRQVETPMYSGYPVAQTVATTLDGSAARADLDLSKVESGTYWVWFNADDGRNPPVRAYAPTPIIVSHDWTPTWQADIVPLDHARGFDLSWNDHPSPDVDSYTVEIGTQPGIVDRVDELGDQLAHTVDNLTPGQLYYFTVVALDEETGRTSRSETISRIATGPTFDLTATNTADVVAGNSVPVTLTLTTPADSYPDAVQLSADNLPDGVAVSFNTPEAMALPTKAGTTISAVITTTASMVGGVYDVPIQGSNYGVQRTATVRLTVREPRIAVQASSNTAMFQQPGDSASVALAASSIEGATGAVDLDLVGAPAGLVYRFSQDTLAVNGSVTLLLTDTSRLANGTYAMSLRAERGLQQQIIPLTLTVRKPVFHVASTFPRLAIQKGETATFAIGVDGQYLSGPVTLRLGAQSSPISDSTIGFAAAAGRAPKPSLAVAANGTAYLIVQTSSNTPAGNYRLVIEGQHGAQVQQISVNLNIVAVATNADLGVSQTTSARTAVIGDLFTYTVRVANYGPLAASTVRLVDDVPVGSTVVAAKPSRGACQVQSGTVTCDLYTLRRGAAAEVAITVRVNATLAPATRLVNTAQVTSATAEGYDPDNRSVETTLTMAQSDVAVSIAGQSDQTVAGDTMSYQVVAWNNGASVAKDVAVVTTLPDDVELISATPSQGSCRSSLDGQAISCDMGDLSATSGAHNATINLQTRVKASALAALVLESTVSSATADRVDGNNTAQSRTAVAQDVALAITHAAIAPQQAIAGDEITYQLVIANTGRSDAPNTVVVDTLPAEVQAVQIVASQGTCGVTSGQVTCNIGTLAARTTATVTVRGRIDSAARATLYNTAQVSSSVGEANVADNSSVGDSPLSAQADLSLSITSVTPQSFQFVIDNNGLSDATGVTLDATVPDGLQVVDVLPTRGTCSQNGTTITCAVGTMKAKDRVVVNVRGTVQPGVFTVAVAGRVAASEYDPRELNNSATKASSLKSFTTYLPVVEK